MQRAAIFFVVILSQAGHADSAEPGRHWSFEPPRRPALPAVRDRAWPVNAIDYFVLAQLEAHGLAPSARADRATLLRRVTLDLTGVPPSIMELEGELFANSPDSYPQHVARLLASPRFGERMAGPWLDAARFADTHGFLIDAHREMWPWRDWVINAFNRNLPFDRFTVDQLAGDLLPAPTLDQLIATGFNRNHMINYENGAEEEEYRVEYVADRAETTASVWLGLTFQCARCHDHKYDPLSTQEFHQWFAFFNNVPDQGLDGNLGNAVPVVSAPTVEQQWRLAQLESKLSAIDSLLGQKSVAALQRMPSWEPTFSSNRTVAKEARDTVLRIEFDRPDQLARDASDKPVSFRSQGVVKLAKGRRDQALLLDGQTYIDLDSVRWPAAAGGITLGAWVFPTTADEMDLALLLDTRQKPRLELRLEDLSPMLRIFAGGSEPAFVSRSKMALQQRRWQHIAVTWDGTTTGNMQWFRDGLPEVAEATRKLLGLPASFSGKWRVGSDGEQLGFRGMLDEILIFARELTPAEIAGLANQNPVQAILSIPSGNRTAEQIRVLTEEYLRRTDAEYPQLAANRDSLKRQLAELRHSIPTSMVMQELSSPRAAYVLRRGKFDQRGQQVEPGTPAVLSEFPNRLPRNRLGLAQWLVQPSHPLTARVMVNRLWQSYFGAGLVRTPEDFGVRGQPPTHPELLDWLAVEFVESGWDVKHIVRLIVTSSTYRQSSRIDSALLERDPDNRWLARAPRLRMDAEMLRDSMLFVSGLLDQRIGGPSVFPYQPPGLWEEVTFNPDEFTAQKYFQSHGTDLYRRGLYTFWKRTLPPPAMAIFDAPTRETCVVSRGRSNTPLQALVLMNDPTCIEAARHLASRGMLEQTATAETTAAWMFRITMSRPATVGEQRELVELFERQLARFQREPAAALRLLSTGDSPRDKQLDPARHAAWTVVANTILSLDEAITRN